MTARGKNVKIQTLATEVLLPDHALVIREYSMLTRDHDRTRSLSTIGNMSVNPARSSCPKYHLRSRYN